MLFKIKVNFVILLSVFIAHSLARSHTSNSLRPTELVYKIDPSSQVSEIKNHLKTFYQDYSKQKTQTAILANIPTHDFLRPSIESTSIVSHANTPVDIIMMINQEGNLSLPGGDNMFGELPIQAAVRTFKEHVKFKINTNIPIKSMDKSKSYGKQIIISNEQEQIVEVSPVMGMYGRTDMSTLQIDWIKPGGPFIGVFGVANRNPNQHKINMTYQFTIPDRFINLVPGPKCIKPVYCNITNIIAKHLGILTSTFETHALTSKMKEIINNPIAQGLNKDSTDEEVCTVKIKEDQIKIIYRYYLMLVDKNIIHPNGDYVNLFNSSPPILDRNLFYSYLIQVNERTVNHVKITRRIL